MKKISLWQPTFLAVFSFGTLLPVFTGYVFGFLVLVWLVWSFRRPVVRLVARPWLAPWILSEPFYDRAARRLLLISAAALFYFVLMNFSEICSYFSSDYAGSGKKMVKEQLHFFVKQGLLWFVLGAFVYIVRVRQWDILRLGKPFAIFMGLYTVYCIVQRYTGIDLSHGLTAILPDNRYAYGVYRISGAMDHPLSFSFNLMMVTLASYGLARLCFRTGEQRLGKCWLAAALAAGFMLLISGSRSPLAILLVVLFGFEYRLIWKQRWYALGAIAIFGGFVVWEGSLLGRMQEMLATDQAWMEKVPRLRFWLVHSLIFNDYPIFGVGFTWKKVAAVDYYTALGYHDKMYTAHNIFLQTLADSGLVGGLGLLVLFASFVLVAYKQNRDTQSNLVGYLTLAAFLSGLVQNNLRDSEFLFCFWFWLAFSIVASEFAQQRTALGRLSEQRTNHVKDLQSVPDRADSTSRLSGPSASHYPVRE